MDGPKSLHGGASQSGFHGRPQHDDDLLLAGLDVPGRSGDRQQMSTWIDRLTGQQREQRRGSVGFSEHSMSHPLSRMDEDSNGMADLPPPPNTAREETNGIAFCRKREMSMSELQTPGGDGDTFVLLYRPREPEESSSFALHKDFSHIRLTNPGQAGLPSHSPKHLKGDTLTTPSSSTTILEPIAEMRAHPRPDSSEHACNDAGVVKPAVPDQPTAGLSAAPSHSEPASSIFLIDIEMSEDSRTGQTRITPHSKKFSTTNLLQNNWLFRKDKVDQEDSLVPEHESDNASDRKISIDSTASNDDQPGAIEEGEGLTFLGKFRKVLEQHPNSMREMNTWAPQGH